MPEPRECLYLTAPAALRLCRHHGRDYAQFLRDTKTSDLLPIDASGLLDWLNYSKEF